METQEQKVNRLLNELDQTDPLWVFKAFQNKDKNLQMDIIKTHIMQWMRDFANKNGAV